MLEKLKHISALADSKWKSFSEVFEGKNKPVFRLLSILIFFIALNYFYSYVGIYKWMSERPCSVHSSAQCIRASVAMNYYNVDMNFFRPRIQRYQQSGGITGVEFPVIYYAAAIGYKLFGFNDSYLKIISLAIVTLGIFFFYRLSQQFLRNTVLSLLLVCTAIVSPVLLFYSANFMPDAPAFALVLGAWYFFFQYLKTARNKHLNLFVAFGTLASLIKVVSVMCFLVVFCLLVLDSMKFFKNQDRIYLVQKRIRVVFVSLFGIAIVIAWYAYARVMYKIYGNPPTAMEPMMVWDKETLDLVWKYARNWIFDYFSYESYILFAIAGVLTVVLVKQVNRLLLTITVIYLLGCLCYLVLFLYQFMHHDYYIIAMLPCAFFILLTFFDAINKFAHKYSLLVNIAFTIIVFFNVKESVERCRKVYNERFESKAYLNTDYRAYHDLEPRLRALGIKREDKFASAFDQSYSNTLYFINQAGITIGYESSTEDIARELSSPEIKYLVLSDSAGFNKVYPNDFAKNIILYHRGLIVYKLKE